MTSASSRLRAPAAALAALLAAATASAADKAAAPATVTYGVTGLFVPDRVADLREAVGQIPDVKLVAVDYDRAEATFAFDPAGAAQIAKPKAKPDDAMKRLDNLLRTASNHTFTLKPRSTATEGELTVVVVPVAGLDCKACGFAAYEAVYKLEGVERATASFKEGRVTATIRKGKTDRAALEAALKLARVEVPKE